MPDTDKHAATITPVENRSIVSLKVFRSSIAEAHNRLTLAEPLCAAECEFQSLWLGPGYWLLVSDTVEPGALTERCNETLAGLVYQAIDKSAGLAVFRVTGDGGRELLATGSGLDLRAGRFSSGDCCRTRMAKIATTVVAARSDTLEVYLDRSHAHYFSKWFNDAAIIAALAVVAHA